MKKTFDVMERVQAIQKELGRMYWQNPKQFLEDLRKVRNGTKRGAKGRRKRKGKS